MEGVLCQEFFKKNGEAVVGGREGDVVGGGFYGVGGVAHGYAEAGPLDHVDVVGAVSDGDDFLSLHA